MSVNVCECNRNRGNTLHRVFVTAVQRSDELGNQILVRLTLCEGCKKDVINLRGRSLKDVSLEEFEQRKRAQLESRVHQDERPPDTVMVNGNIVQI